MKKYLLLIVTTLTMSGCGEKVYDAVYYQEHHEKAEEMLKECATGDEKGENCTNARTGLDKYKAQAFKDYMLGKSKELPR